MPELPEDQREPVPERVYPPIRGGGPGDGAVHHHEGGGAAIQEGDAHATTGAHSHANGGTGLPVWVESMTPASEKRHHFHIGGPTGPAIWTGPNYPNFILDEAGETPPD